MLQEQLQFIPGPSGNLQSKVNYNSANSTLAIMCHPHPLHGGTMDNKVIYTATRAALELNFNTIRFNYRGVQQSDGEFGDGIGEAQDLQAVVSWARQHTPFQKLVLIGFSFGSFVACSYAYHEHCDFLVTIAPAIASHNYAAITPIHDTPWLLIQGMEDEVVDAAQVIDFMQKLNPSPIIEEFADTSHFFHGKLTVLKNCLEKHLQKMA